MRPNRLAPRQLINLSICTAVLAVFACPSASSAGSRGSDPATACQVERLKQTAKYAKCLLNAEARAVRAANTARVISCEEKFAQRWGESASAGGCVAGADVAYVRGEVEAAVYSVAVSIEAGLTGPGAFVDNGDGTITDPTTGLMWEKKDEAGELHDRDTQFDQTGDLASVFEWIAEVNAEGGTGFAGHDDWRLPTIDELQTIIRHDVAHPALADTFHDACEEGCTVDTCSCTSSGSHWTSTGYAFFDPDYSWTVNFFDGQTAADAKFQLNFVRLVRDAD
jgi:hypothetical protein